MAALKCSPFNDLDDSSNSRLFLFVVYVFCFLQDSLPVNHDINAKTGLPAYLIENEGHFFDSLMYSVRVLNPFVDLRQTKAI